MRQQSTRRWRQRRLTIVGLGRIGGSLGLALKKAHAELEIVGHDKDARASQQALKRGAVDKTEWNLLNACDGAGLIVLAIPFGEIKLTLDALGKELAPGVIVTDTAATKAPVLEWAQALAPGVNFVGGDPILAPQNQDNPDRKGIDAADADLFQNAAYCLTPTATTEPEAIRVLTGFVTLLGAQPLFVDAAEHDGLVAGAQHLAYILSAALLQTTTASSGWRELSKFAGRDFMNATELAARAPASQRAVLLSQRADLVRWIDASIETLQELRGALARGDADALDTRFQNMLQARADWLAGQVGTHYLVDLDDLRNSPMRMFLGGIATRGGRERKK